MYGLTLLGKSATYKLSTPLSEHNIYFTVVGNNTFFVNCKKMENFEYVTALMTSYSKLIDRGALIEEITKAMKESFDPRGPYIIPGTNTKVNSIIHHLGTVLERHYQVGQIMESINETNNDIS